MARRLAVFMSICLFVGALLAVWLFAGGSLGLPTQNGGELRVVCIGTAGDADSTLLVQEGAAVLIDTGEAQDAAYILEVLAAEGVTRLDYLIITHPDADHIGGAQALLEQLPVGVVVQSYAAAQDERAQQLAGYLAGKQIATLTPTHTRRIQAGGMRLLVYPPLEKNYSQTNNTSLAVLVQHGSVKLFFAGDALRKRSEELLQLNLPAVSLYHVAHHGRANNATAAVFKALQPQYAVVTAATADEAVLAAAGDCGTALCYTAQGNRIFVSDASRLILQEENAL